MLNIPPLSFPLFNLEGEVLAVYGLTPSRPKFLLLGVEDEQVKIKLPKKLRKTLMSDLLRVGHRIVCIGKTQIDQSTGVIKMTALQLLLPPREEDPSPG